MLEFGHSRNLLIDLLRQSNVNIPSDGKGHAHTWPDVLGDASVTTVLPTLLPSHNSMQFSPAAVPFCPLPYTCNTAIKTQAIYTQELPDVCSPLISRLPAVILDS